MPYTSPFTRYELLDCARTELKKRPKTPDEIARMEAIVGVFEAYPHSQFATTAVRVIVADLKKRGGFGELIQSVEGWPDVIKAMVRAVEKAVVYHDPLPGPETAALDFDLPQLEETDDGPDFA